LSAALAGWLALKPSAATPSTTVDISLAAIEVFESEDLKRDLLDIRTPL
jgi:hypothetical protein